jgi:hypothetical protein
MQNIDPVLFVQPVVVIALSAGLIVYWRFRRRFAGSVLLFSLIAYAGAIALKELVQIPTYGAISSTFGSASIETGIYFGVQTSLFEVGLAYLVARYAVSRRSMGAEDAESYGISLAFWENGVLLGALTLLNLGVSYFLIADGLLPASVYQTMVSSNPSLFYPPQQLLGPVALGIVERASSLLAHFAWGYLCVLAAVTRKRRYLLIALPMGLVDALVPLAVYVRLWELEAIVFALSLCFLIVALTVSRGDRRLALPPPKS